MKRATLVSQGTLNRMLQAAEQAWHQKDFQQNIELLERVSRMDPANISILLLLGRMHGLRFDYATAERYFERAVRLSPRKTETLALAGAHCRDFRQANLGENYLRRAAEQKNVTAEMLADLAELCERQRRLDEAGQLIQRALHMAPSCPLALLGCARLERQAQRLDEAEKMLRQFPANSHRLVRVRVGYELGGILDRQGRYDEAMTVFQETKALLATDAVPFITSLQTIHERLKNLPGTLRPDLFQQWKAAGSSLSPSHRLALLGGHPRSGTTLLEQVLDSHPEVVSAEETEIFLDEAYQPLTRQLPPNSLMMSVLEAAQPEMLRSVRDIYFRSMEKCIGQPVGDRLLIDKNPSYTFMVPALARIFPEIKFLIVLRDPRDVILSCFMQPFYVIGQTNSAYLTLVQTIEEYASVMNVWQVVKPLLQNPWLEIRYEDMVDNLECVARRALKFLDLSWDDQVLGFDEHARKKAVRSPTYADVTQPVYKRAVGRWRNYQKYLEPHLEKLEPFVKAFGYE